MATSDRAYWNESVADWRRQCRLDSSILEGYRARGDAPGVTVFTRSLGLCQGGLFRAVKELERAQRVPVAPRGGCGLPGHVTERADEGTCHCATCEREADTEAMRLEELDAAPARQEVYHGD